MAPGEVCLTMKGERHWPWWAVDEDSQVLDIRVARRRDQTAERPVIITAVEVLGGI